MAKAPRNKFIDMTQYLALRTVAMLLHSFPVNANLQGAKLLGSLMYRFDRKHRARAMGNLRRSFPDMSEKKLELMARRSMQQLVMLFIELIFTTRLVHLDSWADYCELSNFKQVLQLLLKRNQGLIMLTGHYGNWEILGLRAGNAGISNHQCCAPIGQYLCEPVGDGNPREKRAENHFEKRRDR